MRATSCLIVVLLHASLLLAQDFPPVVVSGAMPLYPPLARMARLQGEVILKVTTSSEDVSSVQVLTGHPMLANAAEENVKTWRFAKHKPASFETTFTFLIEGDYCVNQNGSVELKLPLQVKVSSPGFMQCGVRSTPTVPATRVVIDLCDENGKTFPCEDVKVTFISAARKVSVTYFHDSDGLQGFNIPQELTGMVQMDIHVWTPRGAFVIKDFDRGYLQGTWHIGIAKAPYREDEMPYGIPPRIKCVGFIHFENREPEPILWVPCM